MLLCNHHHIKSLEESTYTPAILSPRSKDRKLLSAPGNIHTDKSNLKPSHQIWMELVQRLYDRTSSIENRHSIRPEKSRTCHEKISPWYNEKLNSNKQVVTLINHYSTMLTADNNEQFSLKFNNRPKSILRSKSLNRYRFNKEVTFAIN